MSFVLRSAGVRTLPVGKRVRVSQNLLTGTLPTLENLALLVVSGNLLEGTLPNTISSRLSWLVVSGGAERSRGLSGQLPPALHLASRKCCDYKNAETLRFKVAPL